MEQTCCWLRNHSSILQQGPGRAPDSIKHVRVYQYNPASWKAETISPESRGRGNSYRKVRKIPFTADGCTCNIQRLIAVCTVMVGEMSFPTLFWTSCTSRFVRGSNRIKWSKMSEEVHHTHTSAAWVLLSSWGVLGLFPIEMQQPLTKMADQDSLLSLGAKVSPLWVWFGTFLAVKPWSLHSSMQRIWATR